MVASREPKAYKTGPAAGRNPSHGVTRAASWKRKAEEIRATARFGGFPIPQDVHPVDVLTDELKRSTAFCWWIESKVAEWPDELIKLGESNFDDKGGMQTAPTNDAMWLDIWLREREHLAKVARMCIDAGVSERQIALAEEQTRLMITLLDKAFEALELSGDQQSRIPQIMPMIIKQMALPHGEVSE
jgi:hypothetical protein